MGFLTGKTAIITGAGRAVLEDGSCGSIGYGIATAYAKEGANLVITGRNVKKLEAAKEELERLLDQPQKTKTEIVIEVMLWVMRKQMFIDGNKRVAMLFANKMMIDEGCGIITISQENQPVFFEKLIKFYETGNNADLKEWIYQTSIDGIDLN